MILNQEFEKEYTEDLTHGAPHLFILGAGASRACCPNGDKNGKKLPLMRDLIETTGLHELLGAESKGKNIEEIYSTVDPYLISKIEKKISDYFSALVIPDEPTIYDHLVLSLRKKDVIATFNWDPLLFQACQRNFRHGDTPIVLYLHGNVAVGYCEVCKVQGPVAGICQCRKPYRPSRLLYPIKDKNYAQDPLIIDAWNYVQKALGHAFILTIFGYGAPVSDAKAMEIFKKSWGDAEKRQFEEIEIIHTPGRKKEEVAQPWSSFIHTHHYGTYENFYDTQAAQYPRRSNESLWSAIMMCNPRHEHPIPNSLGFEDLWSWLRPLTDYEYQAKK